MEKLADILAKIQSKDTGKYIKHEWQLFGFKMSEFLEDPKRVSMYMKLAKNENRALLQNALDFIKDSKAKSKSKLFMWKLKQLKDEVKAKDIPEVK